MAEAFEIFVLPHFLLVGFWQKFKWNLFLDIADVLTMVLAVWRIIYPSGVLYYLYRACWWLSITFSWFSRVF